MAILAGFKTLLRKLLKGLIPKLPKNFIRLKIIFNSTINHHTDNSEKIVVINAGILKGQKLKQLKKLEKLSFYDNDLILEDTYSKEVDRVISNEKTEENQELINTLKKIIPAQDLRAFRSSLFVRTKFLNHEDTAEQKEDIRNKWGDRGNNICNLCTAGYFEKFIIPMYNKLEEAHGKKGVDDFNAIYNLIVTKTPFMLFLQKNDTRVKIKSKILYKLDTSKKYGLKTIYIHALGKRILTEVGSVLEEIKEKHNFSFNISCDEIIPHINFYIITLY